MQIGARQIKQLQSNRAAKPRDLSIADVVSATADHAERTHKKLGTLIELWEELVPADIACHTSLSGLRTGVLHVVVDSSSAAFELDRLLRGGLTNELRKRFRGTLVRVKTRTAPLDAPADRAR